jgi:hypothetical protein
MQSSCDMFSAGRGPGRRCLIFSTVSLGAALLLQACSGSSTPGPPITVASPTPTPTPPVTVTATSVTYPTVGAPFEALATSSGTVLVSVTAAGSQDGIQVFTPNGLGGLQSSCVNQLPAALLSQGASFANIKLFPDGTGVGGGIGSLGAIFYNLAAVESCTATGFVVSQGPPGSQEGTLAVIVTPDKKFAFVSNEEGVAAGATTDGNIGVVALQFDANGNVTTGTTLLGQIATGGNAIAGMTLSPDGTRLYVTSEITAPGTVAAGGGNPVLARTGCMQQPGSSAPNGLLTVINVSAAEASLGPGAVLATVDAGCSPVRMSETADNSTLWVAVRGDNRVLAFSTAMLESNPNNALLGFADTGGTAPVGVHLFHKDQLLAVANSNRFNTGKANATILYVANPATASVVQTISTGLFPREFNVGPDDGTLYLTNFSSNTLEVISTTVTPN